MPCLETKEPHHRTTATEGAEARQEVLNPFAAPGTLARFEHHKHRYIHRCGAKRLLPVLLRDRFPSPRLWPRTYLVPSAGKALIQHRCHRLSTKNHRPQPFQVGAIYRRSPGLQNREHRFPVLRQNPPTDFCLSLSEHRNKAGNISI